MTEGMAIWLAAFVAGAVSGALYLGLLWMAARVLIGAGQGLLFAVLAFVRIALVLGVLGCAIALGAGADVLLAGLAGFVLVRVLGTRVAGAPERGRSWR